MIPMWIATAHHAISWAMFVVALSKLYADKPFEALEVTAFMFFCSLFGDFWAKWAR